MDINYINSNEEKVRHLEVVMMNVAKSVEIENSRIEYVLKNFRKYIDQDGYQCVVNYIERTKKKMEETNPFLQRCGQELGIMADKLRALKNINGYNNRENGSYKAVRNNINSPYKPNGDAGLFPAFPDLPIMGLQTTKQTWHSVGDRVVFNTPEVTGQKLNSDQGQADPNFKGTCGLCSCQNVLTLAGMDVSEKQLIEYAVSHRDPHEINGEALCSHSGHPDENGGTNAIERKIILSAFGIPSRLESATIHNVVRFVEEGKGVIASVHAGVLWNCYFGTDDDYHAVTVTSIERNKKGDVTAVYICDSGRRGQEYSKKYDINTFKKALTGNPLNVTSVIIR